MFENLVHDTTIHIRSGQYYSGEYE